MPEAHLGMVDGGEKIFAKQQLREEKFTATNLPPTNVSFEEANIYDHTTRYIYKRKAVCAE